MEDDFPPCVSGRGHRWQPLTFATSRGSTFMECGNEGCGESGFLLTNEVIPADRGNDNDEGLF